MLKRLTERAEQAEVFEIDSEAVKIGFEANKLKSFKVEETQGVAVRVLMDGRLGFAASSDVAAEDRLVENALASARYGDQVPLRFPESASGPDVRVYDPELANLAIDRLIEMGMEMIETVREADGQANVRVDLTRRVRRTMVRNSRGSEAVVTRSPLSIMLEVERVRGDDVVTLFEYFTTAQADDSYREFVERVARKLRMAQKSAGLSSGRMPVLFAPSGAPVLALPLLQGLNGKNAYRGISPMAGRVGGQLFHESLTVVDDPTLNGRPGSGSHDDEGVPRRRNVLIDRGRVTGFIYDLKTAALASAKPTGSGERGLFSPPSPSFSNMVIEGGDRSVDDLIAGIDTGLLVESPLGLGQGNVISGAFSNNLSLAFRIEAGEVVGRVKDVSIAGNIYEDLQQIEALSRESEWVYGGMQLPYILLPELNVVTRA